MTDTPAVPADPIAPADQKALHHIATAAIAHALDTGRPRVPELDGLSETLRAPGASFVTLRRRDGTLRGCIGRLEAYRALALDVADNAYGAAFRDPRFAPLTASEWIDTTASIAVLGAPRPIAFDGERDLRDQLEPGLDGLILQEGGRRGTFLPAVWESLPDPTAFLEQLKRKIGWAPRYWSDDIRAWRYRVQTF